jgi:hypothetical protein
MGCYAYVGLCLGASLGMIRHKLLLLCIARVVPTAFCEQTPVHACDCGQVCTHESNHQLFRTALGGCWLHCRSGLCASAPALQCSSSSSSRTAAGAAGVLLMVATPCFYKALLRQQCVFIRRGMIAAVLAFRQLSRACMRACECCACFGMALQSDISHVVCHMSLVSVQKRGRRAAVCACYLFAASARGEEADVRQRSMFHYEAEQRRMQVVCLRAAAIAIAASSNQVL